jgi:hypothetical protein
VGMPLSYLASGDLETTINQLSMTTVGIGSVLLILLVFAAIAMSKRKGKNKNKGKLPVFLGIAVVTIVTTLVISGGTVFLNLNSYVGGPVHWHADTEFWVCGNEMELRDPQGVLSNKIGSPTLHEHNDKRVHLEGVPITSEDASLGKFMRVIGGELTDDTLVIPLNKTKLFENGQNEQDGDGNTTPAPELVDRFLEDDGEHKRAKMTTGQRCGDQPADMQVFVYQADKASKTYKQVKLNVPADYAISHYGDVPAGDCVIFEFGPARDRTDKLCRQFGIRDTQHCERFGVKPHERSICEYKEVK